MNMEQPKFRREETKELLHEGEISMPHQTMEEYREALDRRTQEGLHEGEVHMPEQTMEEYRQKLAEDTKARTVEAQLAEIRDRLFNLGNHSRRMPEEKQPTDDTKHSPNNES